MDTGKRRVSGRLAAVVLVVMMVAVPAAATVITENFMKADLAAAGACFVKAEGPDALATADADVDTTSTIVSSTTGVTLLQETVTVTGYAGDRVTYTDVVRYRNNCDYDVALTLTVADDPAGGAGFVAAEWADKYAAVYLSTAAGAAAPLGGAGWDATPIEVNGGVLVSGATGTVTVAAGAEVQTGFVVETDFGSAATSTLRWTAQAMSS